MVTSEKQRAAKKLYYQTHKEQERQQQAKYRKENLASIRAKQNAESKSRKRAFAEKLHAIKQAAGCVDCGRTDIRLDFDHVDPTTKLFPRAKAGSILGQWLKSSCRSVLCVA